MSLPGSGNSVAEYRESIRSCPFCGGTGDATQAQIKDIYLEVGIEFATLLRAMKEAKESGITKCPAPGCENGVIYGIE